MSEANTPPLDAYEAVRQDRERRRKAFGDEAAQALNELSDKHYCRLAAVLDDQGRPVLAVEVFDPKPVDADANVTSAESGDSE